MSIDYRITKEIVDSEFASRLKLNKATQDIYLDDAPFDIVDFRNQVFQNQGVLLTNDKFIYERVLLRAREHPFSPIEDYLNAAIEKHIDVDYQAVFRTLNEEVLHIQPDSIESVYLPKTLVAAVKRIYEPGSQHDTVLIIKGGQGFYKTTLFKELAGHENFASTTFRKFDKDEMMFSHSKWIIELEEIEGTIRSSTLSQLKGFITRTSDTFRKPYTKQPITINRQFILVGTTNMDEFLIDDTGNRRFLVISIDQKIDIDWVKANRDLVWAAAVKAYRDGYATHLNKDEQEASNVVNREKYQIEDAWTELVRQWVLLQKEPFTLTDVFTNALDKSVKGVTRKDQERVKRILNLMGLKTPTEATRHPVTKKVGKYYTPIQSSNLRLVA